MPQYAVTVREDRLYAVLVVADTAADAIVKGIADVEDEKCEAYDTAIDMENCDAEDISAQMELPVPATLPPAGEADNRGQSRPGNGETT